MNIKSWLTKNVSRIPSASPQLDAELLLAERLGKTRAYLFGFSDEELNHALLEQLDKDINQLESGYPLAYLLAKKDFWDMTLKVNQNTLIPRADTETLIEKMLTLFPKNTSAKMADLGTGSGAIAISLSREFPLAKVTAIDFSEKALELAKENAKNWQKSPIQFINSSWLEDFPTPYFDAIISNPPYIDEDDEHLSALQFEPITALTAENNGLADIETIINQSCMALNKNGWLLLEHGYQQGKLVRALFNKTKKWKEISTHKDMSGNDRITIAQLHK